MNLELTHVDKERTIHCFIAGDKARQTAIEAALLYHLPIYETDRSRRTRISVLFDSRDEVDDFVFEYKELFDNSFYRRVEITGDNVATTLRRPQYYGQRMDFVDVEWQLIVGRLTSPVIQDKLVRWSRDSRRQLVIALCYDNRDLNARYAERLSRRLPESVTVLIDDSTPAEEAEKLKEETELAKYLNYCYAVSFDKGAIPAELPQDEVDAAWAALPDERMRRSSIHNVRTIPFKMLLLGHDRNDWETFYALTAKEIDSLTAVEHNRWTVERLIQGVRPCTDDERAEIEEDFRRRGADRKYAQARPVTLKKQYARGRGAHFDLCAFPELGVDETGLPVTRYDRDLTEAIPLMVKTYIDRFTTTKMPEDE